MITATMDPVTELLDELSAAGITVRAQGARLQVDAPPGVLTNELRSRLLSQKPALLGAACDVCGDVQIETFDLDGRPRCKEHDGATSCGLCGEQAAPMGVTVCMPCAIGATADRAMVGVAT